MAIPRYTTPTVSLTFSEEDLDLTQAVSLYVTFTSGNHVITKTGSDLTVTPKNIDVWLSQNETGAFGTDFVKVQVNWIDAFGNRMASDVPTFDISEQLLKKVVE